MREKAVPKPWPDPRDPEPPPSKARDVLLYFVAAVIGAGMIANLARGLLWGEWNW